MGHVVNLVGVKVKHSNFLFLKLSGLVWYMCLKIFVKIRVDEKICENV